MKKYYLIAMVICLGMTGLFGQDIVLPEPRNEAAHPVIPILMQRQSSHAFATSDLSNQVVAEILWASLGVNRPLTGKRTTNFSWDSRDTEVYAATADGVFLYKAPEHTLELVLAEDIRGEIDASYQTAPLTLLYVSDYARLSNTSNKTFYAAIHAAFCAANVYLYCAAENLGALVRSGFPAGLKQRLSLRTLQNIMLVQTVGHKVEQSVQPAGLVAGLLPMARVDELTVLKTLKERRSYRSFASTALSDQVLGELLWCGFGVNRPDGKRTAPSAWNSRDIDIYVAKASGVYVYRADPPHKLVQISNVDIRAEIDSAYQNAPATLIFVSDKTKLVNTTDKERYACFHTGFVSQNVYAYCASERLGGLVRSSVPGTIRTRLNLTADQQIIVVQTVGYWASQPANCRVTFAANPGGQVSGTLTQSIAYAGSGSTVTAIPDSGQGFKGWSGGVGGMMTANPLTLSNVVCDMNLKAEFVILGQLTVVSPNGGETWRRGENQTISWNATNVPGHVIIELLQDGEVVGLIAQVLASQGSYVWAVGEIQGGTAPAGQGFRVRVRTSDGRTLR